MEKLNDSGSAGEVILRTGQGSIEMAVEAMKLGAYDDLTKPYPLAELEVLIQKASERHAGTRYGIGSWRSPSPRTN